MTEIPPIDIEKTIIGEVYSNLRHVASPEFETLVEKLGFQSGGIQVEMMYGSDKRVMQFIFGRSVLGQVYREYSIPWKILGVEDRDYHESDSSNVDDAAA